MAFNRPSRYFEPKIHIRITQFDATTTFVVDHPRLSFSNLSLILLCYNTQSDFDFGILLITDPTQNFSCRHLVVPLEEPLLLFLKIMGSVDCLVNDGDAKDGCKGGSGGKIVRMEKKYKHIESFT
ncbi:hypothetical protein PVK06_022273 [Gossypium arboreum]|uniref:Uncharacterized protein n=1 Tax=Gossypium arboreum TaxID=29729 RepID=A0ABR0P843_GOSAR|nr:hypothetical protein PVK06_022273 [Gossypium arboreum]